jgi:thioredoxin-related protein
MFKLLMATLVTGLAISTGAARAADADDLDSQIGKVPPRTGSLRWENDYRTALQKAKRMNKPMFIMASASWCSQCKALERETLNDPWVRHFLSNFVIVKVHEDREVESIYGVEAYPTLVFANSSGVEAYRTRGNQGVVPFLGRVVKGFKRLQMDLPEELQTLIDQGVLPVY